MYCTKCGKQVTENAIFCGFCGAKMAPLNQTSSGQPAATHNKITSESDILKTFSGAISSLTNNKDFTTTEKRNHDQKQSNSSYHRVSSDEELIIQSENDSGKLISLCLKLATFFIVVGVICILLGKWLDNNTAWYNQSDFDDFMFALLTAMGTADILLGLVVPFLPRIIKVRPVLYVFENHVEGKGTRSGNAGQITLSLVDFNENIANISSISNNRNSVILNMKDGYSISCAADNIEELVHVLRTLIRNDHLPER